MDESSASDDCKAVERSLATGIEMMLPNAVDRRLGDRERLTNSAVAISRQRCRLETSHCREWARAGQVGPTSTAHPLFMVTANVGMGLTGLPADSSRSLCPSSPSLTTSEFAPISPVLIFRCHARATSSRAFCLAEAIVPPSPPSGPAVGLAQSWWLRALRNFAKNTVEG